MATITDTIATPTKLSDGTWGAFLAGKARNDLPSIVTIRTAAGKTWQARVISLEGERAGGLIVRTVSLDRPAGDPTRHASLAGMDEDSLAERGLIRVSGGRGSYVRKMDAQDLHDA